MSLFCRVGWDEDLDVDLIVTRGTEERTDGHFDERVTRERRRQGHSQREMALLVGVSIRTYKRWEAGEVVPFHGENLIALAQQLRMTPNTLLYGREEDD